MGIKTTTLFDSRAAARRRVIYVVCGVVVACSAAAFFLIGKGGSSPKPKTAPERAASPDKPPPPKSDEPEAAPDARPPAEPTHRPLPEDEPTGLAKAKALQEKGIALLREALGAERGSEEGTAARRQAYQALLDARDAYDAYLEEHPDAERMLDRRLTELTRLISDCRKDMVLADAPPGEGASRPPPGDATRPRHPDPAAATPPRHPDPAAAGPPRAVPPERAFRPDYEADRFRRVVQKALRDGRPDLILEVGRPLLEDPRMEGHREGIPDTVDLAAKMEAVLDAGLSALERSRDQRVTLGTREGSVSGSLTGCETGGEFVISTEEGEKRLRMADLEASEILTYAELGGGLGTGEARRAAGAYLLLRGDQEQGARELLIASSQGADVSAFEKWLAPAVARSPELKAYAAYLSLAPRLTDPDAEFLEAVGRFKADHGASRVFREHREALFRACAVAAKRNPFEIEQLYRGAGKVDRKGVQLTYSFDDPAELLDFGTQGSWSVEDGNLLGDKGAIWLERFDLTNAELRFEMEQAGSIVAGFFPNQRGARGGVNLKIDVGEDGMAIALRRHDRPFGRETVPVPKGKVSITIQKRDRKYRVLLNRRRVIEETDKGGQSEELKLVGFAPNGGPLSISEMELKTSLDLEWALAGGTRFSSLVLDWLVTGPFALGDTDLKEGLSAKWWPETGDFDAGATGDDGNPRWRLQHTKDGGLDLRGLLRPKGASAGYAAARLWCPDRRSGIFEIGVDDAARVWLNGEVIVASVTLDKPQRVAVKLEPGDNLLLVKVLDAGGGWWAKARFLTKSGEPMRDLMSW